MDPHMNREARIAARAAYIHRHSRVLTPQLLQAALRGMERNQDGWGLHDASRHVMVMAGGFIRLLHSDFRWCDIAANRNGDVAFLWIWNDDALAIALTTEDKCMYAARLSGHSISGHSFFNGFEIPDDLLALIRAIPSNEFRNAVLRKRVSRLQQRRVITPPERSL